ncbi:MAG TPA: hypothetical protein DCX19_04605 [Alphaproteobacteria bacterium]|nr:hypothetical protein [Alphaproteobacteria bacterium]
MDIRAAQTGGHDSDRIRFQKNRRGLSGVESVNPVEIGGHARKFLTSPRLEKLNKEFEQNGGEWKEFKIGELFDVVKGKRLTKENIKPGNINFLGAISSNNGIRERIETTTVWKPNCISVNYNGSVGCSFYQEEPFYASDDVNVCYSKENWILNRKRALFFCAIFKNFSQKFSYTQKWNKERMENSGILLPATPDGTPDFSYMEQYIGELEQARVSELAAYLRAAGLENYDLTAAEQTALDDFKNNRMNFKEFKIEDLFDFLPAPYFGKIKRQLNVSKIRTNEFNLPLVCAKKGNNGIMYYGRSTDFKSYKNVLSVVYNGVVAAGLVYAHNENIGIFTDSYLIKSKYDIAFKTNLFL